MVFLEKATTITIDNSGIRCNSEAFLEKILNPVNLEFFGCFKGISKGFLSFFFYIFLRFILNSLSNKAKKD
jgi:hypothetical protein